MSLLLNRYEESIKRIERIFEAPDMLRDSFIETLSQALVSINELPYSSKKILANQKLALENIRGSTLGLVRKNIYELLYQDAIIFIVSISEYLLKDIFNETIRNNLDKISYDKPLNINIEDLRTNNFVTDKEYWAKIVLAQIHGKKNPMESTNFQNVIATKQIFKQFFDIDLENHNNYLEISTSVHLYFQIRHILLHNGGKIDQRFRDNLVVAGIELTQKYKRDSIIITRDMYEQCIKVYRQYFNLLENSLKEKGFLGE